MRRFIFKRFYLARFAGTNFELKARKQPINKARAQQGVRLSYTKLAGVLSDTFELKFNFA